MRTVAEMQRIDDLARRFMEAERETHRKREYYSSIVNSGDDERVQQAYHAWMHSISVERDLRQDLEQACDWDIEEITDYTHKYYQREGSNV